MRPGAVAKRLYCNWRMSLRRLTPGTDDARQCLRDTTGETPPTSVGGCLISTYEVLRLRSPAAVTDVRVAPRRWFYSLSLAVDSGNATARTNLVTSAGKGVVFLSRSKLKNPQLKLGVF